MDANDLNLVTANLGKVGMFYEHTTSGFENPDFFNYIEGEVEKCQDVVLLLGFYIPGTDQREGGHFVTVAGVNSTTMQLLISNPIRDDFEAGKTPGRSPIPHTHMPPEPPYTTHNNASLVSHDAYNVSYSPSPSGYHWLLEGYFPPGYLEARIEYAVVTSPLGIHDIAVIDVKPWKTMVGQNRTCKINVTITNEGNFTETFDVTLYANTTIIGTHLNITLPSGYTIIISFIWNTTGFAKGNYTISAYAHPVPSETDTSDNLLTDGWIILTILGDLNGDYKVDILDAIMLSKAFGSCPGDPNWNPNADLVEDSIVDILDAIALAKTFGQEDP